MMMEMDASSSQSKSRQAPDGSGQGQTAKNAPQGSTGAVSRIGQKGGGSCQPLTSKRLTYKIHQYSSMSSTYAPENILVDKPSDQLSRWSSENNTPPQFLVLKLDQSSSSLNQSMGAAGGDCISGAAGAVVTSITFGKYEKTHVCNLKRFKVFGGMDESNMIELIDSGLKNDSQAETFPLRHTLNGHYFPCRYVKILPIQSWGPSFNFSVWFVGLNGQDAPEVVQPAIQWHKMFREKEAIRLCLKHFRQKNYLEVFESLLKKTRIQLEHPKLTQLHDSLVVEGNYQAAEQLIDDAIQDGLFEDYINSQQPIPQWTALISPEESMLAAAAAESASASPSSQTPPPTPGNRGVRAGTMAAAAAAAAVMQVRAAADDQPRLSLDHQINLGGVVHDPRVPPSGSSSSGGGGAPSSSSSGNSPAHHHHHAGSATAVATAAAASGSGQEVHPGSRGGHQMVLDSSAQMIYLFGGWDGSKDLSDFWAYNIATAKWRLISGDTRADGGPSQRSCHKMVIDVENKHIFTLGRYLERSRREDNDNIKSDFFMYDIVANKWTLITDDTSAMGGPALIFDHQMCIDQEQRTIYVFGGQSLYSSNTSSPSHPPTASGTSAAAAAAAGPVAPVLAGGIGGYVAAVAGDAAGGGADVEMPAPGGGGGVGIPNVAGARVIAAAVRAAGVGRPAAAVAAAAASSSSSSSQQTSSSKCYSGLYEYHIPTNSWKKLRDDLQSASCDSAAAPGAGIDNRTLKSRSSHSMLFHPGLRKLFIFGGQRKHDEYLNDFFTYQVDTDQVEYITSVSGSGLSGGEPSAAIPAAGYTQRATIDCQRSEIHVMTGLNFRLNKDKEKGSGGSSAPAAGSGNSGCDDPRVSNSFWVYSIPNNKWTCFYRYDSNNGGGGGSASQHQIPNKQNCSNNNSQEPRPRYAHQLVYDDVNRTHYMFGGNPGGKQGKEDKLRLGDFWRLHLLRPDQKEIFRRCCLMIRQAKFLEITAGAGDAACQMEEEVLPEALVFLQNHLSTVVDHADPEEERNYQRLASHLFKIPAAVTSSSGFMSPQKRQRSESSSSFSGGGALLEDGDDSNTKFHQLRNELFEKLAAHFPDHMTHPKGNLLDLIPHPTDFY